MKTTELIHLLFLCLFLSKIKSSFTCEELVINFPEYQCSKSDSIYSSKGQEFFLVTSSSTSYILKQMEPLAKCRQELETLRKFEGMDDIEQVFRSLVREKDCLSIRTYAAKKNINKSLSQEQYFTSPHNILAFIRRIVYALKKIHEAGLVYANLKPSSVYISQKFLPILTDFGNVQEIGTQAKIRGTKSIMSPEMIKAFDNNQDFDYRPTMDYYAVGVLLYYMSKERFPIEDVGLKYNKWIESPIEFDKGDSSEFYKICSSLLVFTESRYDEETLIQNLNESILKQSYTILTGGISHYLDPQNNICTIVKSSKQLQNLQEQNEDRQDIHLEKDGIELKELIIIGGVLFLGGIILIVFIWSRKKSESKLKMNLTKRQIN